MLEAQRTHAHHAAASAVLVGVPGDHAVVHHRALRRVHADVTRTVELRLDLADLRGHQLVVGDQRVLAERAPGRRPGNAHLPARTVRVKRRQGRLGSARGETTSAAALRLSRGRNRANLMVRPGGVEPPTLGLEVRCSIQLSYGRMWGRREDRKSTRLNSSHTVISYAVC